MPADGDLCIAIATEDDTSAVAALRSIWTGAVRDDHDFERRLAAWITSEGERRTTWLASIAELPVGMASMFEYRRMPRPSSEDSRWGYVSNMFVRAEFRGRGIGSALLAAVITAGEQRSYARLVLSPSREAMSLYERAGFVVPDANARRHRLLVRPTPDAERV